jgi:hypothetical protein
MTFRKSISGALTKLLVCTFVAGLFPLVGCSDDPAQVSRESISAPRKGGGVEDGTTGEKLKPKAKAKVPKGAA